MFKNSSTSSIDSASNIDKCNDVAASVGVGVGVGVGRRQSSPPTLWSRKK